MKEMYKSPELEVLCLASNEHIANNDTKNSVDFDDIKNNGANAGSYAGGGTEIDIPLN